MSTNRLESSDALRTVYRQPSGAAVAKVIHHLDDHCRTFLASCPFVVLSTADADGVCDASPKGGAPGFVKVLDDRRVAFADLSGNNRLDSFENIVANPSIAMLCFVPGLDEALRINGTAMLSTDDELSALVGGEGDRPKVVVVVDIAEAYIHCAKAFRRSQLWEPTSWLGADELPDSVCMVRDHARVDAPVEVVRSAYDADVDATLWTAGGLS